MSCLIFKVNVLLVINFSAHISIEIERLCGQLHRLKYIEMGICQQPLSVVPIVVIDIMVVSVHGAQYPSVT